MSPVNAFSLWPPDGVRITKGEENVATFNKTETAFRKFCKICGGHVMSDHPGMGLVDIYATIIPDLAHEPTLHVYYDNKTISMTDGLPKFKDLPADFGSPSVIEIISLPPAYRWFAVIAAPILCSD